MKRRGGMRPDEGDIRKNWYCTPWDAPITPPSPFRFGKAAILTLYARTKAKAMALLMPSPTQADGDVACVHIYKMDHTDWRGPYVGANVMFGASLAEGGSYSPWLVLSSDIGAANGGNRTASPRRQAMPSWDMRGDLILGRRERSGINGTMAQNSGSRGI